MKLAFVIITNQCMIILLYSMRQQIFINQMRKAEADEQIEELKKTVC